MQYIQITSTGNLNEFTNTIRTILPQSSTQICVVHQTKNSCKYVVYKDKKEFMADIKIHNAPQRRSQPQNLTILKRNGGEMYPYVIPSRRNNWDDQTVSF